MYRFLPYNCRTLYKMRKPGSEVPRCRRGLNKVQTLRRAEEALVEWEEAAAFPGLFDLFAETRLLNVVFEWGGWAEGRPVASVEGAAAGPPAETVEPLAAAALPPAGQAAALCLPEDGGRQRAAVTAPPKASFDYSVSFAFVVEEAEAAPPVRVTRTETRDAGCCVRSRGRSQAVARPARHPQYFCRSCAVDICRGCLQGTACISHNVQWIGNQTFSCASPHHRAGSCF
jgi:hypothetical protein